MKCSNKDPVEGKSCYFCGKPANSYDHVPPKCFFDDRNDKYDPICVPSCSKHNENQTTEDEYIRNIILMMTQSEEYNKKVYWKKMVRSTRKSDVLKDLVRRSTLKNVKLKSGIILPNKLVYKVDDDRLNKSLKKILKGLFFHHTNQPLLDPCNIIIRPIDDNFLINNEIKVFNHMSRVVVDPEVFEYYYVITKSTKSAWLLLFYERVLFFCFTDID